MREATITSASRAHVRKPSSRHQCDFSTAQALQYACPQEHIVNHGPIGPSPQLEQYHTLSLGSSMASLDEGLWARTLADSAGGVFEDDVAPEAAVVDNGSVSYSENAPS